MSKNKKSIVVQDEKISILKVENDEYFSLTDIAKKKEGEPSDHIRNWMRNRNTIEFLGIWETIHNIDFNSVEFDGIRKQTGLNAFNISAKKWIELTNSIGIISKGGKYGGVYAHKDIALEFASWIDTSFKLYIIKEFQRLKKEEQKQIEWNEERLFSKVNRKINTDTIKDILIPSLNLPKNKQSFVYANETDMINKVVFGMTAKEWSSENQDMLGNMRDNASIKQLTILSNIEHLNAYLIKEGFGNEERFEKLSKEALSQYKSILGNSTKK